MFLQSQRFYTGRRKSFILTRKVFGPMKQMAIDFVEFRSKHLFIGYYRRIQQIGKLNIEKMISTKKQY